MNRYIEIEFSGISQEQSDILIAQLSESGFEGFVEEQNRLRAFIGEPGYDEEILHAIVSGANLEFSKKIIEDTNWNQVWESNFDPVIVGDFAAIRADFHEPVQHVQYEIIITPKMSFGTGHHATTYLMIGEMKELDMNGKSVFDFGTGTGVLAILAEKLGVKKIVAIDNDQWSYVNAAENIERNHCTKVELKLANAPLQDQHFDIVLANINKNIILDHLDTLARQVLPGGCLVLSGLLAEDENDILTEAANKNFRLIKKVEKDNWLLLKLAP